MGKVIPFSSDTDHRFDYAVEGIQDPKTADRAKLILWAYQTKYDAQKALGICFWAILIACLLFICFLFAPLVYEGEYLIKILAYLTLFGILFLSWLAFGLHHAELEAKQRIEKLRKDPEFQEAYRFLKMFRQI